MKRDQSGHLDLMHSHNNKMKNRSRMGKLTCGCLNVKIHTKKSELAPLDVSQSVIPVDPSEDFFNLEISEQQLDLEGVRIEHGCLMKKIHCSGWVVNQCSNCEMYTHATHTKLGATKLLVNLSLKRDSTIIERLEQSPDFSPLYKIVLRSRNDNHPVQSLGLQSGKYESLQETLSTIQTLLNKFLVSEEAAMEERIRLYEEQQRAAYAELQSKVRRDKNAMISLVLKAEEHVAKVADTMTESPNNPANPPANQPRVLPVNQAPRYNSQKSTSSTSSTSSSDSNRSPRVITPSRPTAPITGFFTVKPEEENNDSEALFDLEGMHDDDSRPFYISDDDTEDTDDSSLNGESGMFGSHPTMRQNVLSSSVPVSIPTWRMASGKRPINEDDEEEILEGRNKSPEDIAASIKALARSVHGDGTEMFGDLPRPRINTMDMGKL